MALVVAIVAAVVVLVRVTTKQIERRALAATTKPEVPTFAGFPVREIFTGTPATVDLASDPRAGTFRTRLRRGAAEGPNFAGHYTIVTWGCGTDCQVTAVVDARTGRVAFAPFTAYSGTAFRLDSRLLIENPRRPEDEGLPAAEGASLASLGPDPDDPSFEYNRPGYWVWDGATFEKLHVPDPRPR
jgi:hypothetical protein